MAKDVQLIDITDENWREVTALKVHPAQSDYVAEPSYYLLLCHYRKVWHPLGISLDGKIIGFFMWAIDPDDNSGWIGGFIIDSNYQGKGYGKQAVLCMIDYLKIQQNIEHYALSVQPQNPAILLYEAIGFTKTEEWEGDEIVMRLNTKY